MVLVELWRIHNTAMALAGVGSDVAAVTRECRVLCTRTGRAHSLMVASHCSRRSALLASVATVTMSQLAAETTAAASAVAELPLVPKAPLTSDMDISQVSAVSFRAYSRTDIPH